MLLLGTLGVMFFLNSRLSAIEPDRISTLVTSLHERMRSYAETLDRDLHLSRERCNELLTRCDSRHAHGIRAHTAEPHEKARWLEWTKADWRIKAKIIAFHNLVQTLPLDLIQSVGLDWCTATAHMR